VSVSQILSQDQIVAALFQRALRQVHETRFVDLAAAAKSLGDICRNRHCRSPHLQRQAVGFLPGETSRESIHGQHELVRFAPYQQVAKAARGWSRRGHKHGGVHGVCSRYLTTLEVSMNAFFEHHKDSIRFGYRCFDRILLNGLIQPFQQPERVLGFFNAYREGKRVTRKTLTEIADQFQYWLKNRSEKWGAPILEPPDGTGDDSRRDKFMDPYFENAKPNQVVAILKAREPARILVAIGDKDNDSPHLEYKQRWVNQFNFYLNDPHWGRMFVRMCPYLPFSARVCLNQHNWLAIRMREEGIDFQQCTNAFLKCGNPARLQELADSLATQDLLKCGQKWLAAFTPFITDWERKQAGCQHRLFFSQVEYCDNLIFHRRAAVDEITQRLLDLNRNIGQPKKITMIYGRKVTKHYKGKLQTVIEDLDLPN